MKGKGTGALGKAKKEGASGSSVEESGNQLIADTRHREGGEKVGSGDGGGEEREGKCNAGTSSTLCTQYGLLGIPL